MQTAIKQIVTVQTEGKIEVCSSELKYGTRAEVIILFDPPVIDESTEWSEEDMYDVTLYSLSIADQSMDEE